MKMAMSNLELSGLHHHHGAIHHQHHGHAQAPGHDHGLVHAILPCHGHHASAEGDHLSILKQQRYQIPHLNSDAP